MLEMLFGGRKPDSDIDTGYGPNVLLTSYQDTTNPSRMTGYYGTIPASELINGPALATGIGKAATLGDDVELWFKCYIDGKIVLIPKRPASASIGWQSIYNAGAVYGSDNTGTYYSGAGIKQDKVLALRGYLYRLRLLTGYDSSPTKAVAIGTGANPSPTGLSEWNRLMYNLCSDAAAVSARKGPTFGAGYSYAELCSIGDNIGVLNFTSSPVSLSAGSAVGCRGNKATGITYGSATQVYDDRAAGTLAWRPVLELVGPVT